jgi:excisionase family DNA binding protein
MARRVVTPSGMSIAEAAEYAGVHHRTIRKWIARGELPAYRRGKRLVRIRREDIDAMD